MRYSILMGTMMLALVPATFAAKITTTEQLIQALQQEYAKSWYKTATFVQKTTNIDKDGNKKVEIWYEALSKGKSSVEINEDPRICELMMQAEPIIEELDEIVNTAFPNHPEKVARWKKAMGIEDDGE